MSGLDLPVPQNPIGENYPWRDWFTKLSQKIFGTLASLDWPLLAKYGGTGQTTYAVGDILYCDTTDHLTKLSKPSSDALLKMSSAGIPSWKVPAYGAFYSTTNFTPAATTPTALTYNNTQYSSGVSIGTPTSRVVIATAGIYNVQFSIQLENSSATIDDCVIWMKVNGTNVTDSAGWIYVPAKHGAVNGQLIATWNYFYQFAANDYFELYFMNTAGTTGATTVAAGATYPESPSIILTVSDNIAA